MKGKVENWGSGANGTVQLERVLENPFANYSKPRIYVFAQCKKFMCDFVHSSGKHKPWLKGPPRNFSAKAKATSANQIWYQELSHLNDELNMGLNFSNWELSGERPPLGLWPDPADMDRRVRQRANQEVQ